MSKFITKVVTGFSTVAMAVSMFAVPATSHAAMAGEVYKTSDGTVWFINKDMQRRPFTSWGAFLSYGFLSGAQIKDADSSVTALSAGSFIAPQDGRIFCATETKGSDKAGECALITAGKKARFTSAAVFTGQGYSFSRAYSGDSSFLENTTDINNASAQHRPGTLINNNGTIQLVVSGGLWGVPSMDVFNSWGWSFSDVVPANSADVLLSQTGVIPARMAGDLVPTAAANDDTDVPGDCNIDGVAGDVTITLGNEYSGEEVGEGEEEVPVMDFDVEADDDSDVAVTSVKVELEQTNAADSEDITDYIDEVVVMFGDEVVGSADAEDFSENSDRYSKSITLDDCVIVDAGEEATFTIAITANESLDSADIDTDVWDVELDSLRFEDGDGVTTTETPAADAIDRAFDFGTFAAVNDVELTVALADSTEGDDINDAHVIDIDDNSDSDDVEILAFTLEATGDSDINVTEIPVTITTTGETDEAVLLSNATLWMDGELLATEDVPTGGAVTFEDLDIDVEADEEVELIVGVTIQDTDGAADNGDTVQASVTSGNADAIEAEDETGEDVATTDLEGSAVGDAHAVYDAGIMVELNGTPTAVRTFTADAATEDDQGTYTIMFDVTAFDADAYIDDDCEDDNGADAAGQGTVFDVNSSAGTPTGGSTCLVDAEDTVTGDTSSSWRVIEGQTRTFTFTVTLTADSTPTDGNHQVILESINWDDEAGGVDATPDFFYNFNMDEFKTPYLFLNGIA